MKNLILSSILFIAFTACSDDDRTPVDPLESTNLFGRWEIETRAINNIMSLEALCCEFVTFSTGDNSDDKIGSLVSESPGFMYSRTFTLGTDNQSLLVELTNETKTFTFAVSESGDYLELEYIEDGSNFSEGWRKVTD